MPLFIYLLIFCLAFGQLSAQTVTAPPDTAICHSASRIILDGEMGNADRCHWTTNGDGSFYPDDEHLYVDYRPGNADIATGKVTLTLTAYNDQQGTEASDQMTITFLRLKADFITSPICKGKPTRFTNRTDINHGSLDSLTWYMSNDTLKNVQQVEKTFDSLSQHTVELQVFAEGCSDHVSKAIMVHSNPVADFDSDPGCGFIQYTNRSSIPSGTIDSTLWNFDGDSLAHSGEPVYHPDSNKATVEATLIVTSDHRCKDTLSRIDSTLTVPKAQFTPNQPEDNYALREFVNQSASAEHYYWYFGDGSSSQEEAPRHEYPRLKNYRVTLIAESESQCRDTAHQHITISNPVAKVANAFTPNGDGVNDVLHVQGGPFYRIKFRVYDEWGNLVFRSNKKHNGWDGSARGEKQPAGIYYYTVSGVLANGENFRKQGTVFLMR